MRFCDIPGHSEVKERLRGLVDENRIPHALLLEGPDGIGKHALARAFLQYVTCTDRHDGDSCGQCASCRQHESMQYIDTIYSFPYVKRKNENKDVPTVASDYLVDFISFAKENPFLDQVLWLETLGSPNTRPSIYVAESAELIRRLSFAPNISKYNTVIIWQADSLREDAANKLLKLVEEPPGNAIIVMTSARSGNILPTIYSRVQRIKVKRLTDSEIADWLVSHCGVDSETASDLAPLASGSVVEALRILNKKDDSSRYLEYFMNLMRLSYKRDIAALKGWATTVASEKRETIVDFLEYMARMLRENFIANLNNNELILLNSDERNFSRNFARFINERNVEALFEAVGTAISDIRANVSTKMVLFDLAITVILKLKQ